MDLVSFFKHFAMSEPQALAQFIARIGHSNYSPPFIRPPQNPWILPANSSGMQIAENFDEVDERVKIMPKNIPMIYQLSTDHYYVRECYDLYYEWTLQLLNFGNPRFIVTITGTPGIGKSIFYLYFAERFLREYPDWKIIATACTRQGTARVYARVELDQGTGLVASSRLGCQPFPLENEKVLYLFDGPPTQIQFQPDKMVVFTSPNNEWFKSFTRNPSPLDSLCRHGLGMNLWTLMTD
jgi:hypothetical protein